MSPRKPVVLCILDGWGLREETSANAPALARTPAFDSIMRSCPTARLVTHGAAVGLPEGQMGNSEVGHMNIGAGRVVWMDLPRIDAAIEDGSFAANPAIRSFADSLLKSGGAAHLVGVMSDGGVHGHLRHMAASARTLSESGVPVLVHALADGRDVAPKSADRFLESLERELPRSSRIATVAGRYFAMDRDSRWDRVESAARAIVFGEGRKADSARVAVMDAWARGETDEFIMPTVVGAYSGMEDGDGLFCLNFRADRARELLSAIADPEFGHFSMEGCPALAARLGMVEYSEEHSRWYDSVMGKQEIKNDLGHWVALKGQRQLRIAETEKYPHVTFFLNCGREDPEPGEDRFMAPSPKVATYDMAPEMSAGAVTKKLVEGIGEGYGLIVVNYANPDMVGHTGDLAAAITACEAVDRGLAKAVEALERAGGVMLVTADHGNCELMVDPETGGPHTAHTTNPVPAALVGADPGTRIRDGTLADIAPTLLDLMGLDRPPEMTGAGLLLGQDRFT